MLIATTVELHVLINFVSTTLILLHSTTHSTYQVISFVSHSVSQLAGFSQNYTCRSPDEEGSLIKTSSL